MSGLSKDNLRFSPSAAKFFKKLKDKKLINLYKHAIDKILENPLIGTEKTSMMNWKDIYVKSVNIHLFSHWLIL